MKANKLPHKIEDGRGVQINPGNYGDDNGKFKTFLVIKDPNNLFKAGVAKFGMLEVTVGVRQGDFPDGMEFMVDGREAVVRNSRLVYKRGGIVHLAEVRL